MIKNLWFGVVSVCLVVPMIGLGCADVGDGSDAPLSVQAALRAGAKVLAQPATLAASTTLATSAGAVTAQGPKGQASDVDKDGKPEDPDDNGGGDTGGDGDDDTGDDTGDSDGGADSTDCAGVGTTTTSCQHLGETCRCTYSYFCDEEDGDCKCAAQLITMVCGGDRPVIGTLR